MPNTVHGPYTGTTCVNGVTPLNATLGNLIQTQSAVALASFNPDLLTPFVESGITCTKDGTNANQLDIASGEAYVKMTDGTVARIDVVTDNTHLTSTINTTYHLYLQPDGTWYWSTSNSPQANSLAICNVATDGGGNITTVTDLRTTFTALLPNISGHLNVPKLGQINDQATVGAYGVAGIAQQSLLQHVTTTAQTDLIFMTVPTVPAGAVLYRAHMTIRLNNSSSGQTISGGLTQWTDFDGSTPPAGDLWFTANVNNSIISLHGATSVANGSIICLPMTFWAQSGSVLGISYTDPGGTPNDYVTVVLERLA